MKITLTERAARQIRQQLAIDPQVMGLRISTKNVGCSGFAYTYELATDLAAGEQCFECHGVTLVVPAKDSAALNGACLDFVSDGLKQRFQFDNPNVGNTCGCGESFSLKGNRKEVSA